MLIYAGDGNGTRPITDGEMVLFSSKEQGEGQKLESIPGRCTCPLEFRDMAELR